MSATPLSPVQLSSGQIEVLERFAGAFDEGLAIDVAGKLVYGEARALYDLLEMVSPGAGEPWKKHHRESEIAEGEPDPWADDENTEG